MSAKAKIAFFGNEKLATGVDDTPIVLPSLIKQGYHIGVLVLSQKATRHSNLPKVTDIARAHDIPIIYFESSAQVTDELHRLDINLAVVVAFGRIIGPELLTYFAGKLVNIHPSLLPLYRGPSPIEETIIAGDCQGGVSIIELGEGVDDGPILAQKTIAIEPYITKQNLTTLLKTEGSALLCNSIDDYLNDQIARVKQDESNATTTTKITKSVQALNTHQTADDAERLIRAYAGWPGSCVYFANKALTIISAQVSDKPSKQAGYLLVEDKQLFISFTDKCLQITNVKLAGKAATDAQSFINGMPAIKQSAIRLETLASTEE